MTCVSSSGSQATAMSLGCCLVTALKHCPGVPIGKLSSAELLRSPRPRLVFLGLLLAISSQEQACRLKTLPLQASQPGLLLLVPNPFTEDARVRMALFF